MVTKCTEIVHPSDSHYTVGLRKEMRADDSSEKYNMKKPHKIIDSVENPHEFFYDSFLLRIPPLMKHACSVLK